ncbi:sarcosine oxidase subunit gamma [Paracoccus seriniphilus]|uniref:Sarcosine oxidase, gamma subunit family, heterotetrameric form n=1 Tax=Paracoccus seriniphilus TaxID=184748 RepID=A0A239Q0Z5_9RHOB|nr:sarcosine oxidase subunit gamma family protein [Paracoccus seriniphilus]WCR15722.1 hypothetical protein JHW44_14525 [Paracoccus seriniphilus]SNT75597.1 sarcosine oxidase, gamma subunit family, heterotetrameric form [Paracoccus seriniphilus]
MMLDAMSALGNSFGSPAALADITHAKAQERSDMGAVLITVTGPGADFAADLAQALGCDLPRTHGAMAHSGDLCAIWLTPRSWILLCPPEAEADLLGAVATAFPDRTAHASRFTDALGWLTLEGAGVEDLLHQGGFISLQAEGLPVGHAKRTLLAGIPAVVLHEGETRWTIGVERSRCRYFTDWLAGLTNIFGERE